jgi:hypothetical protein
VVVGRIKRNGRYDFGFGWIQSSLFPLFQLSLIVLSFILYYFLILFSQRTIEVLKCMAVTLEPRSIANAILDRIDEVSILNTIYYLPFFEVFPFPHYQSNSTKSTITSMYQSLSEFFSKMKSFQHALVLMLL